MHLLLSAEDLEWLRDVHGIEVPKGGAAIIDGNDDWPEHVFVYAYNNLFAPLVTYAFDEDCQAYVVPNDAVARQDETP